MSSVDLLKLDCEGADLAIMHSLLAYCDKWPATFPRIVAFETNLLSSSGGVDEIVGGLCRRGYRVLRRGFDTILKRETNVPWVPCCKFYDGSCTNDNRCFFDHVRKADASSLSTHVCCYGEQCSHGHGGVKPKCIVCGDRVGLRQIHCKSCWRRRLWVRDDLQDEQSAYWNAGSGRFLNPGESKRKNEKYFQILPIGERGSFRQFGSGGSGLAVRLGGSVRAVRFGSRPPW